MKKDIILIIFSSLVGVLLSFFMFKQYDNNEIILTNTNTSKYYFVELGSFSSYDNMISSNNKLNEYIYSYDNNIYYVYGCITKNKKNLEKIEGYFKDIEYITYIKEFNISNTFLDTKIEEIDKQLETVEDNDSIKKYCKQTLLLYKEG